MSSSLDTTLSIYTKILLEANDFTPDGVRAAYKAFCDSLKVHKREPPPKMSNDIGFVQTTLQEAIKKHNRPVYVPYFINEYGNKESTIIKYAVLEERDGQTIVIGVQDGEKISPLSINQLRCCYANGYYFDSSNTVGSASTMGGKLAK